MIRWFIKYGFVLLLFNTIFYSIDETKDNIAPFIFYAVMSLGLLSLLFNPQQTKLVLFHRSFLFLLILNLINLTYYLFLDDIFHQPSFEYLIARFTQFSIISFAVYYNQEYFKFRFFLHLVYFIMLVVVLGLVIYPNIFIDRYSGIIWNPNMLASLTVIAFSVLLLQNRKKSFLEILSLVLLFIIAFSTGSRSVILAIGLAFLFKYRFSLRNALHAFIAIIMTTFILSIDLDTSINRISSGSLLDDRLDQYSFALENISKKLYTGYGLDEYSGFPSESLEMALIKHEGEFIAAHNGYLTILIQYGIIFGIIVIFIILIQSIRYILLYRGTEDYNRIYMYIVVYTLVAGMFESLFTGINEFQTLLFWFSLSMISFNQYNVSSND